MNGLPQREAADLVWRGEVEIRRVAGAGVSLKPVGSTALPWLVICGDEQANGFMAFVRRAGSASPRDSERIKLALRAAGQLCDEIGGVDLHGEAFAVYFERTGDENATAGEPTEDDYAEAFIRAVERTVLASDGARETRTDFDSGNVTPSAPHAAPPSDREGGR